MNFKDLKKVILSKRVADMLEKFSVSSIVGGVVQFCLDQHPAMAFILLTFGVISGIMTIVFDFKTGRI